MPQLRRPSHHVSGTYQAAKGRKPEPALALVKNRTCPGCVWVVRCCRDGICWAAEKAAIAKERL